MEDKILLKTQIKNWDTNISNLKKDLILLEKVRVFSNITKLIIKQNIESFESDKKNLIENWNAAGFDEAELSLN